MVCVVPSKGEKEKTTRSGNIAQINPWTSKEERDAGSGATIRNKEVPSACTDRVSQLLPHSVASGTADQSQSCLLPYHWYNIVGSKSAYGMGSYDGMLSEVLIRKSSIMVKKRPLGKADPCLRSYISRISPSALSFAFSRAPASSRNLIS